MKTNIYLCSWAKFAIPAFCLLLAGSKTHAQNIFPSTGRAGIYTASPASSLQVKGGARIGTLANYLNVDSATGNLSFVGTSAYRVAGNKYAFQYSGNTNYGLFFNSTGSLYEFRNGSAVPVFSVNANNGNSVFNGTLKVGAYTLPATDGGSGQVLKTNGAGALTWSNDNTGGAGSGWSLTGNAGTDSSINFIGIKDAHPLAFRVNNQKSGWIDHTGNNNTSFGYQGLLSNTTGFYNTAVGYNSLKANIVGGRNTAVGAYALVVNTADNNTAIGTYALSANTSGTENVATGLNSLSSNTTGINNSAYGTNALYSNTTGEQNTANGYGALFSNQTGNENLALGKYALYNNNGNNNSGVGFNALFFNTTGTRNTATGSIALQNNTSGSNNVAEGYAALGNNFTGNNNTAIGYGADVSATNLTNATAIGANAIVSVSNAIVLGNNANVGIGINSPSSRLQVVAAYDGDGISVIGSSSIIGSGPKSAGFKLSDNVGHSGALGLASANNAWMSGVVSGDIVLNNAGGKIHLGTGPSSGFPAMTISGGKVGIGTFNPAYQLSVNGTIQSKEVRVETGWSDYVFEKDYKLRSLDNVAEYIAQNKHLPGIPSAKEIQDNGLAVGEVQTKMMAKIEELTLYVIELQKQLNELKKGATSRN